MRVAVALSGGVDSAVSAALVQAQGHDVVGVHLLMGTAQETADAQRVADRLGVELLVWDLREPFTEQVIGYFVDSYARGLTPNPCLRCNRRVKFGGLLARSRAEGFDAVATGHYARITRSRQGLAELRRAADPRKDQSYVLAVLGQQELSRLMFPLGEITGKDEVRALADRLGLPVADKPDSTDICFISAGGAGEFLAGHLPDRPGDIVDEDGRVIGRHKGTHHFTIGQRRGLRLGRPASDGRPRYVTGIDAAANIVRVGQGSALLVEQVLAERLLLTGADLPDGWHGAVQFRAHGAAFPASMRREGDRVRVVFDDPVSSVAPGQFVVLYEQDVVRGCAEITATRRPGDPDPLPAQQVPA
ncbi:tRNA-specific 2-thiouridylase mnmA [Propionibacterium australiense]|nr:tRNA-specific 2-thiouridylase MnmA [mnmA] [Propionibacterium australiense]VEH90384.1 tRNA-specific 2-thiouridylase mnmA [Propionibacterium australiense]